MFKRVVVAITRTPLDILGAAIAFGRFILKVVQCRSKACGISNWVEKGLCGGCDTTDSQRAKRSRALEEIAGARGGVGGGVVLLRGLAVVSQVGLDVVQRRKTEIKTAGHLANGGDSRQGQAGCGEESDDGVELHLDDFVLRVIVFEVWSEDKGRGQSSDEVN